MVILGHAINNITHSALFTDANNLEVIQLDMLNTVIYSFHMPLFFFMAGMFADHSLRYPVGAFLRKRAVRYAVPYFAWTLIVVLIKTLTPGIQNNRIEFSELLLSLVVPFEQYWFLYVLFFISVMYYFVMNFGKSRHTKSALFAVSLVLRLTRPFFPNLWILENISSYLFPFMLGTVFSHMQWPQKIAGKRFGALALAVGFVAASVPYAVLEIPERTAWLKMMKTCYAIALALIGIALVCVISFKLSKSDTAVTRILLFCGLNSMQLYCLHPVPMGGIRLVLNRLMSAHYLWARTLIQTFLTVTVCCLVCYFWPNDSYLHLILFGEKRVKNRSLPDKKDGPIS